MPDQVSKLIEKLRSSDRDVVKASVIEELGKLGDHRSIRPLIDALDDSDTLVRWNAIKAISNFGSDALAQLLRELDSGDKFKRRNIVQALGEVGGEDAVDRLIKMLMFDETDSTVLVEIIRALHKLRPQRAVEPLITVLKMDDWEMKWRAINTLGYIGDPRAAEPLLEALNDNDPDIKWAASIAIENIKKRAERSSIDPAGAEMSGAQFLPASRPPKSSVAPVELSMTTTQKPDLIIIHIDGDINSTNAKTFHGFVEGVISASSAQVELDLKNCDFIDSFGLSQFNMIRKKLRARNRQLRLTGLNPNIISLFEATKLDNLFEIRGKG
ncbi:MAG TPA: anti-sigma factor antagonist [bacterium]|nr:anti-sigma factor antagonist [bacterium]